MPYKDYTEQLNNSRARHEKLKNDPEYKKKNLEYAREYYLKNRKAKLEYGKAYYDIKKEKRNLINSTTPSQS